MSHMSALSHAARITWKLPAVIWIGAAALLWAAVMTPMVSADSVVGNDPLDIDVLVLNYNPPVPSRTNMPLHEVMGWNDPVRLSDGYLRVIRATSGGFINYRIAEWRNLDHIPVKTDGFQYDIDQYVANWNGGTWHDPDTADYVKLLNEQGVPELIRNDEIDEVWIWGGPYFGYWESAMAGPGAFYINGGVYPQVESDRPFAVMGFNYERGLAEMLHSLGHRVEASVSRVFGGWNIHEPQTDWDRFTANVGQTEQGPFGVGSVHYPANATQDYQYDSTRQVLSIAALWSNYPDLSGDPQTIDSSLWNSTHNGYMRYWLDQLPDKAGLHEETGRVNNWWKYVYDWTSYGPDGKPIEVPEPAECTLLLWGLFGVLSQLRRSVNRLLGRRG